MQPTNNVVIKESVQYRRYLKWLLPIALVVLLLVAAYQAYFYFKKDQEAALLPVTLQPFEYQLVLDLDVPVKDSEGIPYSGVVSFNPKTQAYAYIASADGGVVTPLGTQAFTSLGFYLANRTNASSSDLVIYNKNTFAAERVVEELEQNAMVATAVWSQNGEKFAYFLVDQADSKLAVEAVDGTAPQTLSPQYPIGFSPDATKLLVRSLPALTIVDIETGEQIPTTKTAFVDLEGTFLMSPSGNSLVTYSGTQIDWYTMNWTNTELTHRGSVPVTSAMADVVFTLDDTLVVRDGQSDLILQYEYQEGKGVLLKSTSEVTLPPGARILNVITW